MANFEKEQAVEKSGLPKGGQKKHFVALAKKQLPKAQSIIEGRIIIDGGDLHKVLKTSATSVVTSVEVLEGQAVVNGKTTYCVVYANNDGEYKSASLIADFSQKVNNERLKPTVKIVATAEVIDSDISGVSESEIKIASVTDLNIVALESSTINYADNDNENIFVKRSSQEISYISDFAKTSMEIDVDFETKYKVASVLHSSYQLQVTKASYTGTAIKIEGEVEANVCYTSGGEGEEDISLKTVSETIPFIEEISFAGLLNDSKLEIVTSVQNTSTTANEKEIGANIQASICIIQTSIATIEPITDAFCTSHHLNLTFESSELSCLVATHQVNEKISSAAPLNLHNTMLNKVLGSSIKNLFLTSVIASQGYVTVEGLASIIAYGQVQVENSEEKQIAGIDVQVPFSIKTHIKDITITDKLYASAVLTDVSAKHNRTNEVDVSCSLKLSISVYQNNIYALLKEIDIGELKTPNTSNLSLYTTKSGDTPFEICKKFSMPMDMILKYNDDLKDALAGEEQLPGGMQVIVYRRRA